MFVFKILRFTIISAVFLAVYLPITLNPEIFERKSVSNVSYIVEDHSARANVIDY